MLVVMQSSMMASEIPALNEDVMRGKNYAELLLILTLELQMKVEVTSKRQVLRKGEQRLGKER